MRDIEFLDFNVIDYKDSLFIPRVLVIFKVYAIHAQRQLTHFRPMFHLLETM